MSPTTAQAIREEVEALSALISHLEDDIRRLNERLEEKPNG